MAAIIAALLSVLDHAITAVNTAKAAAQQSGEWTPEQDRQFNETLAKAKASSAWKTDDQVGNPTQL